VMKSLPADQIHFMSSSSPVYTAHLFEWETRFCKPGISLISRLLRDGTIDQLVTKGFLVEIEPASLQVEGYDLVLKHRRILSHFLLNGPLRHFGMRLSFGLA